MFDSLPRHIQKNSTLCWIFLYESESNRERGRENVGFSVADALEPSGFKE